ncbi:MAG: DNA repair protein RecO [Candidatus Pacebacteria bacterium]|nr:DNA repair protein RecO [Candidatus Paceibacterota bacterium]
MSRTFNLEALILKRVNTGETDRVVTLLSREKGKLVCVAKGVRKLNSSKRAFMEPGNLVKAHFVQTKSLPLLIQAKLISDSAPAKSSLVKIRQLTQVLEVFDKLFVEEELDFKTFQLAIDTRDQIVGGELKLVKPQLGKLISLLGFPHPDQTKFDSILDYVQQLAERPMRSFEYLQLK